MGRAVRAHRHSDGVLNRGDRVAQVLAEPRRPQCADAAMAHAVRAEGVAGRGDAAQQARHGARHLSDGEGRARPVASEQIEEASGGLLHALRRTLVRRALEPVIPVLEVDREHMADGGLHQPSSARATREYRVVSIRCGGESAATSCPKPASVKVCSAIPCARSQA